MATLTRKIARGLFFSQKRHRKFLSASAALKNKDEFLVTSPFGEIVMPKRRFIDHLWRDSSNFENVVALQCAETKRSYTYKQLFKSSAVFGTSLRKKLGLIEKDVVFVMLPNLPEFVPISLGTIQAGCVLSVTNPAYKEFEISHQVHITEPKVLVTIPECYEEAVKGLKKAKIDAKIVLVDFNNKALPNGAIRYTELAENGEADNKLLDSVNPQLDDVALIPFSSGTTGLPKGVEITHKNLLAAIEIMGAEEFCFPFLSKDGYQDVLPCVLPFFHIYGFVINMLGHLRNGCKLVTIPKFSPNVFFDVLKNEKISLMYVVPPIAILLAKHPDVQQEHFRHMRRIICGAAPLSASDVDALLLKSKRDIHFHQGYGATETTSLATSVPKSHKNVDFNACGLPMSSMEFKFIDTMTEKPVPIGQPGELLIRSPTVMKGYYKNQEATKEAFTEDGFFKTGDLGYFKKEQGLYITERIKELIKVKGSQVAPAELEGLLRTHPSVVEAAVIGVSHQFYGEVPKAFVIPKAGTETSVKELLDFVSGQVAEYKKIEELTFVKDIPKTASGKILRKELRKIYA